MKKLKTNTYPPSIHNSSSKEIGDKITLFSRAHLRKLSTHTHLTGQWAAYETRYITLQKVCRHT